MKSPNLTCVLVGCGAIVELQYVPALQALPNLEVVGLLDPSPDRVAAIRKHFPNAVALDGLGAARADFAIVASPSAYHAEQTLAAFGAGMHVLCEKPMATTAEEASQMVEAATAAGRLLVVGLFRRFFPAVRTIRDFVAEGTLGAVKHYRIAEGGEFNWPAVSKSFFQKERSKGGVLLDLGAHTLDLLCYWFGVPETLTYEDDADGGLEASCRARFEHREGVSGELHLSRDWATANRYFIEFERGWLAWRPGEANRLELGGSGAFAGRMDLCEPSEHWGQPSPGRAALTYHQCFTAQLAQFADAIAGGGAPKVTGEDGLVNLRLIERCYSERKARALP